MRWARVAWNASIIKPGSLGEALPGRLTLGLYNTYDPKQWHDVMRITLARAAPVAAAFDCDLATFGFPYAQSRRRHSNRSMASEGEELRTPEDIARFVVQSSSIGDGADHLVELATTGHFRVFDHLGPAGWPTRLGKPVATTPTPAPAKRTSPLAVAQELAEGHDQLLVIGLGPRGLPEPVLAACPVHLELTGRGISMETATALAALPAVVMTHLGHLESARRIANEGRP